MLRSVSGDSSKLFGCQAGTAWRLPLCILFTGSKALLLGHHALRLGRREQHHIHMS